MHELRPTISFALVMLILLFVLFPLLTGMRESLGINQTWQRAINQWHHALAAGLGGTETGSDAFMPLTASLESKSFQALIRFSSTLSAHKESLMTRLRHLSVPYSLKCITEIEIELDNITAELNRLSSQQLSSFESLLFVSYLLIVLLLILYGVQSRRLAITRREVGLAAELKRRSTEIYENERKKIARDLHDGLSQNIALARMSVDGVPEGNEKQQLRLSLDQSFQVLRNLLFELRSAEDFSGSLIELVRRECRLFQERFGLAITVHGGDLFRPSWDSEHYAQFFRILHEGLINVIRHSGTQQAEVALGHDSGLVELFIRDRGRGIGKPGLGFGIKGMEERTAILGGRIEWNSSPGKGTEIHLSVQEVLP